MPAGGFHLHGSGHAARPTHRRHRRLRKPGSKLTSSTRWSTSCTPRGCQSRRGPAGRGGGILRRVGRQVEPFLVARLPHASRARTCVLRGVPCRRAPPWNRFHARPPKPCRRQNNLLDADGRRRRGWLLPWSRWLPSKPRADSCPGSWTTPALGMPGWRRHWMKLRELPRLVWDEPDRIGGGRGRPRPRRTLHTGTRARTRGGAGAHPRLIGPRHRGSLPPSDPSTHTRQPGRARGLESRGAVASRGGPGAGGRAEQAPGPAGGLRGRARVEASGRAGGRGRRRRDGDPDRQGGGRSAPDLGRAAGPQGRRRLGERGALAGKEPPPGSWNVTLSPRAQQQHAWRPG